MRTQSRMLIALRGLFRYLRAERHIEVDPAAEVSLPRAHAALPTALSLDEVEALLRAPDAGTPRGCRDLAMLELLYATGLRVTELCSLRTADVHIEYLSTIGRSGTATETAKLNSAGISPETIGQFGVGLLSAFVVAEQIDVFTRKLGGTQGFHWRSQGGDDYEVEVLWANKLLASKFANPIAVGEAIYGLSGGTLVCLDKQTGARRWRGKHYGPGQMLSIGGALLILSEQGQVVLVATDARKFRELTRLDVFKDRTWNTPALAGRQLFVRTRWRHHVGRALDAARCLGRDAVEQIGRRVDQVHGLACHAVVPSFLNRSRNTGNMSSGDVTRRMAKLAAAVSSSSE